MRSICLCFRVHHPFHFQQFNLSDVGSGKSYYDDLRIEKEIHEACINYYLPSNDFLLSLINQHKDKFKLAFYISSTASDQFLMFHPEVLTGLRQLTDTRMVDFLGSTYSHSLITLTNHKKELIHQIKDHQAKTKYLFGVKPQVFVNSDLMYSDLMGKDLADAGYRATITNGARKTLEWRSPNFVYSNYYSPKLNVYFRNETISDMISQQLQNLTSDRDIDDSAVFSAITNISREEPLTIIYLDYHVLGGVKMNLKHQFLKELINHIVHTPDMRFVFPSEIAENYGPVAPITATEPICWVKNFHPDYYPGNELQVEAIRQLYMLLPMANQIEDLNLHKDWQYLQTSDHIHLMDNQHPYYNDDTNPERIYRTKYDAFANFMNILDDFRLKIHRHKAKTSRRQPGTGLSKGETGTDRLNEAKKMHIHH
jgi:alpha-amylase